MKAEQNIHHLDTSLRDPENGTLRVFDGEECIFYDGYWIHYYAPPEESLAEKKRLIDALTRRTFHHTEIGINTPGEKLELARQAYNEETDPARKRVNAAMLAGALFNRATDLFTTIVELEETGVKISDDNELMQQCSACFEEALELGKLVKHRSGHEGVDELWGEPLKVFTLPIADFYQSRYVKIAQTMRDIDKICERINRVLTEIYAFEKITPLIDKFAETAKLESGTMKSDKINFKIWPAFVAAGEKLLEFEPQLAPEAPPEVERHVHKGERLLKESKDLVGYIAGLRVPMPKTTREFLAACDAFSEKTKMLGIKSSVNS